jgi:hypothetical protein
VTSQLSATLRAAAGGLHPDEATAALIISHGTYLGRDDFTRHLHTGASISDGIPMAWIDWDGVITALGNGQLPFSGGERRILRIAASLAAGHLVDFRDAIPGFGQHNLHLLTTAIRHAAGQRHQQPGGT